MSSWIYKLHCPTSFFHPACRSQLPAPHFWPIGLIFQCEYSLMLHRAKASVTLFSVTLFYHHWLLTYPMNCAHSCTPANISTYNYMWSLMSNYISSVESGINMENSNSIFMLQEFVAMQQEFVCSHMAVAHTHSHICLWHRSNQRWTCSVESVFCKRWQHVSYLCGNKHA